MLNLLAFFLLLSKFCVLEEPNTPTPLEGAWRLLRHFSPGSSDTVWDGISTFHGNQFVHFVQSNARNATRFNFLTDSLTSSQKDSLISSFHQIHGAFGTFEVRSDTIFYHPEGHFNPYVLGRTPKRQFELRGDTLYIRGNRVGTLDFQEDVWIRVR